MATEQQRKTRKLAVILHADVAGSTLLVQKNELIAHERIQESFRQLSDVIASYGGAARELRGDALVAEFGRASDSVCAALRFQSENSARNEALGDGIRPEIRIGISLGEVVIADGTVTGAGIVLAQRLEQLAEPGGVVVQGTVAETVPGRMPFVFDNQGERKLKGFEKPVRAFTVSMKAGEMVPEPETTPADGADRSGETPDLESRPGSKVPSIAVLPFVNMSGDPEQDYFSDGITEDIITELSRFRDLVVIARNSSFVFKGQSVGVGEVGRKLGVEYVVEGSVRKSGARVRVTAQLVEAASGNHVWADRYDRDLQDIFEVQDEVVRIITSTLVGRVGHALGHRAQQKPTLNLDAYEWLVQGREFFYKGTSDGNAKAMQMFETALSLDPGYAAAHALLAETYTRDWMTFWNMPLRVSLDRAWVHAGEAISLDDTDSCTHAASGVVHLFNGDVEQAIVHLDRALALNPSDTHAGFYRSRCDLFAGDPERAIAGIEETRRYNPFGKYDWGLVPAYYVLQRYAAAIDVMRRIPNPAPIMLAWMGATYAQAGDPERALDTAARYVSQAEDKLSAAGTPQPPSWVGFMTERFPFQDPGHREHLEQGLRKAGVPG